MRLHGHIMCILTIGFGEGLLVGYHSVIQLGVEHLAIQLLESFAHNFLLSCLLLALKLLRNRHHLRLNLGGQVLAGFKQCLLLRNAQIRTTTRTGAAPVALIAHVLRTTERLIVLFTRRAGSAAG